MGLSFQKSETLCMGKTGLSLSVLCRGSFPEKPGRLSETEEIQAVAAARNGAQCVTSDKAQRGQNKWGEWWLFKNMTELVSWLNTDTHPDEFLLTEAFRRHFATNQSVAGRSGFPRGCAANGDQSSICPAGQGTSGPCHAPDAARCALGDWWRLLLCPAAQVIANLQLPVLQSCVCYRP